MKDAKLIILIIVIMLFILSPILEAQNNIIFQMNDPLGDEYGPGTYTYPKSEQFKPYEGLFDLTNFKVEKNADNYDFYFKFVTITNPWHAKYGFSHQLIQVYIDNQEGGKLEPLKPGANIKFEEKHPWNKLIKVTGWSLEVFDSADESKNKIKDPKIDILDNKQTIKVTVNRSQLGDLKEARYYVLIGALDGFGYDNYREVVEEPEGWKFGGGLNTNLNPNVIDTLVPEGLDQKEVLGSFNLDTGEVATLRAVGPELGLHWKFIIILAFTILLIVTILGGVIKYFSKFFNKYQ